MNATPLYEEARAIREENLDVFYAPQFEVKIEGVGLPRDILRDVVQITYKDKIEEIDGFEIVVNNWDATNHRFKYTGAETAEQLRGTGEDSHQYRIFEPCNKTVEVRMGYVGYMRTMLTGNFTTMEPNFPSGAASTLNVRGLNLLHQLRRKQYTHSWLNRRDSDIARNIATLRDRETRRNRFPIPVDIDTNALNQEPILEYVSQRNQYDIDFLLERARERGYVVFIQEPDPDRGRTERRLYFGPSQEGMIPGLRDVTFRLDWGRSLVDFKPTLTTANQIRSVTVNGWDRRRGRPIRETVTLDDRRFSRNRDLYELLQKCDPREEIVVDEPVFCPQGARERAFAILSDRQKEMVKTDGTTVGLPDLRAGQRVVIGNIGARFSGTYFVTETTHTINNRGYVTKFKARREDEGD